MTLRNARCNDKGVEGGTSFCFKENMKRHHC